MGNSSLASQVLQVIDEIILPLEANKKHMDIKRIADQVSMRVDPDGEAPALITYAATLHYRGLVGRRVANRATKDFDSGMDDMICDSGQLQEYYPETTNLYVHRDNLSQIGYERNRAMMMSKIEGYSAHLDAFEAWWLEKQSKATA